MWALTIVLSALGIADGCLRELTAVTVAGVCLELMFYISMYGEILMALFFYLYARKKASA